MQNQGIWKYDFSPGNEYKLMDHLRAAVVVFVVVVLVVVLVVVCLKGAIKNSEKL